MQVMTLITSETDYR